MSSYNSLTGNVEIQFDLDYSDGTVFIDSSITGATNTGIDVGSSGFYHSTSHKNLNFRSLSGGANVALVSRLDGTVIEINAAGAGEANTVSNIGSGIGIYKQKAGVNFELKSLSAGRGVGVRNDGDQVSISADSQTAQLDSRVTGLESATAGLASNTATLQSSITSLQSATGTLQTQIGSLWNNKVPYQGATANVNLAQYSLTAATVSALVITGNTVSAGILLNGIFQTTTADVNTLKNIQVNYAVLSANNIFTGNLTAISLSSLSVTAGVLSAGILLNGNFQSTTASFNTRLSGLESGTAANAAGTGLLQTQVGSLWNAKVPYTGATAGVNLQTYGLTANNLSAQSACIGLGTVVINDTGITGATFSAITLLAGNFMVTTASFDSRLTGLESGTGALASGTGLLQTQVGSLWNSKIPYTGATADVNLAARNLTAASLSSLSVTSNSSSSLTLSAGDARVAKIWFGDNTTMTTATAPGGGGGLPYPTGATAGVNLQTYGLTAFSVSSGNGITANSVSSIAVSAGDAKFASVWFGDGTQQITAFVAGGGGGGIPYIGATAEVNLGTHGLSAASVSSFTITGTTVSAGLLLNGQLQTATANISTLQNIQGNYAVLSADNKFAGSLTAVSISSLNITGNTVSAGILLNGVFQSATADISTLKNIQANYAVLSADNKFAGSLTATSISAINITGNTISAGIFLNGVFQTTTADVSVLKNIQANYAVLSANNIFSGSLSAVSISSLNITGNTVSAGLLLNGVFQTTTADVSTLKNIQANYAVLSANNQFTASITAATISALSITGGVVSAGILLNGNFQSTTASFNTRLSGLESGTGNLASGTATLQTQVGSLWNSKVPYSGASADVNLTQYSLTSATISALNITGGVVSAGILLNGNFQSTTAAFDTRLTGLESGTGTLASGTATLQTQVGSLWNAKIPYTGASANLNLAAYSLTADSISAGTSITAGSISAITTLSAGIIDVTTIFFGDNTSMSTVPVAGGGGGLPYPTGATAGVNLQTYGLTADSISAGNGITAASVSTIVILSGVFQTTTADVSTLKTIQANYAVLSANNVFTGNLTAGTISAGNVTGESFYTGPTGKQLLPDFSISANSISAGSFIAQGPVSADALCAASLYIGPPSGRAILPGSVSATSISAGSFVTAGSISSGTLSAAGIVTNTSVSAGALCAASLYIGAPAGRAILPGSISATAISAGNVITQGAVSGGALCAASLYIGPPAGRAILPGSISATSISAGNIITQGTLSGGSICATSIYLGGAGPLVPAGAISGASLSAGNIITQGTVSAGTLCAASLYIGAPSGRLLPAGSISSINISANAIVAGSITYNENPTVPISSLSYDIRSLTIENPTSSEDITVFYTPYAITATNLFMVCSGTTPSVTFNWYWDNISRIRSGSAVGAANFVCTTSGAISSSNLFSSLCAIPANSFVWFKTSSTAGTIKQFHSTMQFLRVN